MTRGERCFFAGLYVALAGVVGWAAARPEREVTLAHYASSLRGRTSNQVHNVALAARSINGRWIRPGETFSYNRALGPWSSDSGYKRAPVSYDGELVPSWGGGVCQGSSTLYNAALLAGLTVVERHRHRWLPHYVPPGRDAAVAYSNIDLKLRNDLPCPVRLEGEVRGDLVEFRVVAPAAGLPHDLPRYEIRQQVESQSEPVVVRQDWQPGEPTRSLRNPGRPGCRVRTTRVRFLGDREVGSELLSDDAYPAMNLLVEE